jgi:signal transduction histidine kinase
MSKDFLRKLSYFEGLSEEDLDRLYELAEPVKVGAGEYLMREGDPADAVYVILDGLFEVTKAAGAKELVINGCAPGDVIGEIGLIESSTRTASLRALKDGQLLKISTEVFYQMLCTRSAAEAILDTVMQRLRNTEGMLMQNEKMAALGNMAAGLAHELNNPAAAARRSTDQLSNALLAWQQAALRLGAAGVTTDGDSGSGPDRQASPLADLQAEVRRRAGVSVDLDPLARSDRETELESWLEGRGISDAYELAAALVAAGWDRVALEKLGGDFTAAQWPAALSWLSSASLVYNLLNELGISARRISEIVKSVKDYSYLDQAPIQQVNVEEGLEETLIILRHKLKSGVHVVRDYARDLPRIEAYGSELNQVWTNIIDNAIDAMRGEGELTLRTYVAQDHVVVEISNSGPVIPPDVRSRIFDPFFTTKGPGSGTGLGLHISRNIVQLKHHGRIEVTSHPGETTFRISLPLQLSQEGILPATGGGEPDRAAER